MVPIMAQNLTHSQLIDKCLISNEPVYKILDFGQHPYADTFIKGDQLNLSEPIFPLQVYLNPKTGSIQLRYLSNAEERYNLYNYSYTSSNSKFARNHWDKYADYLIQKFNPQRFVIEIGSNDGYLISKFREKWWPTLGIDSSESMCELSKNNGQPCMNAEFNLSTSDDIKRKNGPACLVMANNVFNHSNNPVDFAKGVSNLLSNDGTFVFELPYWADSVSSGHLDQVYHEHVSYFTVKSSWHLLAEAGMQMVDFDIVNYHGGSLRVIAKKGLATNMPLKIKSAIDDETRSGLFSVDFYKNLQKEMVKRRNKWLMDFYTLLSNDPDAVIIGVGAAAKANTWLNWHGLTGMHVKCLTDSSEFKQGKYTPLSRIPIVSDEAFADHKSPYALILSWNISEPLKEILKKINPNVRFLSQ
jgi:SAM-dependent methyltransferase